MKTVLFSTLDVYDRFYINGTAYNKSSSNSCVDDYSLSPIHIAPDTLVEVK